MKKLMLFILSLVFVQGAVFADDKPIAVDQLPSQAKQFIAQHFSNVKTSYAKVDDDWFDKSYEVVFVDGNKVEFDKKGQWKEVDCKYAEVPKAIVPPAIRDYVTAHHDKLKIVKIKRNKRRYEVKLENKLELIFNSEFKLVGYDD